MAGRRRNRAYDELGFELVKVSNKTAAFCTICKKNILNTAEVRLRAHRNVCNVGKSETRDADTKQIVSLLEDDPLATGTQFLNASMESYMTEDAILPCKNVKTCSLGSLASIRLNSAPSGTGRPSSNQQNKKRILSKPTGKSMPSFADTLTQEDENEINETMAQFFFACNIPLHISESIYFKNFIKKLRPAYADKIPGRKVLSTRLLDTAYEKCLSSAKATMNSDSVLLIDGWKNSSSYSKTVVAILQNANGEQAFLETFDFTEESETVEKLSEIVSKCVDMAEELYSTHVYAVVSDNASIMKIKRNITNDFIWKINCSSHTGNLLAKDILNRELNQKVTSVLKEFKHANLEKKLVEKGGTRIKLPCDTRWSSNRDAYNCLLNNVHYMKIVAAHSVVKENIVAVLYDSEFLDEVKKSTHLLDPICSLINRCQLSNSSIAEAVDMWLDLQLPREFSAKLKSRRDLVLNKYALTSFYLHPYLDNSKLSSNHHNIISDFLFKILDGAGIEEWDHFRHKTGFFKLLYEKNIKKPIVFWNMAEIKCPTLGKLAIKLLNIPASSAQIERLFSSWAHVHNPSRSRLTFQRSKKLLYINYTLRIKDVPIEDEDFDTYV